ncbi:acyltransferase family protein [Azonexus fungiphilus]|uniref:acyltransferase family protein n=1 Tax=Azonexus fungiphilus TaxID=146940 RepID=UPI00156BC9EC|nr:acyltransferase [Azonexus fungiphilus]NHC08162.1 acyltransferase [Azonexus fungiphilus]
MSGPGLSPQEHWLARNNFDLLRLLFAGTVCLVHAYDLSRFHELAWIASFLSSTVAVKGFFVVSGFLIFMSYERSSSLAAYTGKRVRRIYPAYFTVVMLCALGLVFVSTHAPAEFFSLAWLKYCLANLIFLNFLQPTLPGVFEGNPLAAVNGALWTLKIEAMFYVSVPVFAYLFRKVPRLPAIMFVYCASVLYWVLLTAIAERMGNGLYHELARQLPGQLSYFMSGAFLYYYLPFFVRHKVNFLAVAVVVLVINRFIPLVLLEPFALAVVVVFFGLFPYLGNFGKHGDFSYGAYILHFPIIQLLVQAGWFGDSPALFLAAVVVAVTVGAVLMWDCVEKRFLFRSSHYIAAGTEKLRHSEAAHMPLPGHKEA